MSTPKSCVRCSKTHSHSSAFLLRCSECRRFWHHRCHIPPVDDQELIARFKATADNDVDNGLDAWVCKRCSKRILESKKVSLPADPKPTHIPDVLVIPQSPRTKVPLVSSATTNQRKSPSVQTSTYLRHPGAAPALHTQDAQFIHDDDVMEIDEPVITIPDTSSQRDPPSRSYTQTPPRSPTLSVHEQKHDMDSENFYWNPPSTMLPHTAPSEHATGNGVGAKTLNTTSPSSELIPNDSQLEQEQEADVDIPIFNFELATDIMDHDLEPPNNPLASWILQRHPDEENPWSPFLGIKISHHNRRGVRRKANATRRHRSREGLFNFNLAEWVKCHRQPSE